MASGADREYAQLSPVQWTMDMIATLLDSINFLLPGGRWHLFEFCDLWM